MQADSNWLLITDVLDFNAVFKVFPPKSCLSWCLHTADPDPFLVVTGWPETHVDSLPSRRSGLARDLRRPGPEWAWSAPSLPAASSVTLTGWAVAIAQLCGLWCLSLAAPSLSPSSCSSGTGNRHGEQTDGGPISNAVHLLLMPNPEVLYRGRKLTGVMKTPARGHGMANSPASWDPGLRPPAEIPGTQRHRAVGSWDSLASAILIHPNLPETKCKRQEHWRGSSPGPWAS